MTSSAPGNYPDTFYSATRTEHPAYAPLAGQAEADVCVIGGGLAGLSAAQELSRRGRQVVILEKERIAWGASGRNGGSVGNGWSLGLGDIEKRCGLDNARLLFAMTNEGVEIVRKNIAELKPQGCDPVSGRLGVTRYEAADKLKKRRDHLAQRYGHELEFVDTARLRALLRTNKYYQGLRDPSGFHFHPLNYCLGLASSLTAAGVRIFESSAMTRIARHDGGRSARWRIETQQGVVLCDDVLLCCGGYGGDEFGRLRRSFLPIATYVVLTEALGDRVADYVATSDAIGDDRRSSDYYRVVAGGRLLWGARITTRHEQNEERLKTMLQKDMAQVYPGLRDVRIEKAWSGLMGYASHKMPHLAQLEPGLWTCSSFGGHGMNTAPIGARVVVEAMTGESDRIRLFESYPLTWNGGVVGPIAAQAIYTGLRIADFWQESASRRG